ncbi:MAG TPA: FG-GAP repeat protein [Phototrophicaceae bacterium]|nr:FG-GAP repeat protein [Phototrophicaceae bacterium]
MIRKFILSITVLLFILGSISLIQAQQPQPQSLPLSGKTTTELLTNGSFESDTNADKVPEGWKATGTKLAKSDTLKCDKPDSPVAHTGNCAFLCRGNPDGLASSLNQKVADVSSFTDDSTVTFSAYLDPRSGVPGATFGVTKIILSDSTKLKLKLVIPEANAAIGIREVVDYVQVSDNTILNLSSSSVSKIKVKLLDDQNKGKFLIDDVSLIIGNGDTNTATSTSTSTTTTTDQPTITSTSTNVATAIPTNTSTTVPSNTPEIPTNTPTSSPTIEPSATFTSTPTSTSTNTPTPCVPCQLIASDGEYDNHFGEGVAISGNTVVVGAVGKNAYQGAAYVYVWDGSAWREQAKLVASDAAQNDYFGLSVAVSGDTAVIGAYNKASGAVYIFTRSGTSWTQQVKITNNDAVISDYFGISVAIAQDTVLVGAINHNQQGAAYVFTRSGNIWTQQVKLTPGASDQVAVFGWSTSLSGNTAAVGAIGNAIDSPSSVYIFTRSGITWTQQTRLTDPDVNDGDQFSNALSLDGDTLLTSEYYSESHNNRGVVYVFTRNGTTWSLQATLTADDAHEEDFFGRSVALKGDIALIGATGNLPPGAVYIFTRSGNSWVQQQKLVDEDANPDNSYFGWAISIDQNRAVVGNFGATVNDNAYQGVAWVYPIP